MKTLYFTTPLTFLYQEFFCNLKRPIWKSEVIINSINNKIEYNFPKKQLELILTKLTEIKNFFSNLQNVQNNKIVLIEILNTLISEGGVAKYIPINNFHFAGLANIASRCQQIIYFFIYFYEIHDLENENNLFKEVLTNILNEKFSFLVLNPEKFNEVFNFLLIKIALVKNNSHLLLTLFCRNCGDFFNTNFIEIIDLLVQLKKILYSDKDRRDYQNVSTSQNFNFEEQIHYNIKSVLNKLLNYPEYISNFIIKMIYELTAKLFKLDLFFEFAIKIIELRENDIKLKKSEFNLELENKIENVQELLMTIIFDSFALLTQKEKNSQLELYSYNLKSLFQKGVDLLKSNYLLEKQNVPEIKEKESLLKEYSHLKLDQLLESVIQLMLNSQSESNQSLIISFLIKERCFKKIKNLKRNNFEIILRQFEKYEFSEYAAEFLFRKAKEMNDKNLLFEISYKFSKSNINIKNRLIFSEAALVNLPDQNEELLEELNDLKITLNLQKFCFDELQKKIKEEKKEENSYLSNQLEKLNYECFDEITILEEFVLKYELFESFLKFNLKFNSMYPKKLNEAKELYFDFLRNCAIKKKGEIWYASFQDVFNDILKLDSSKFQFMDLSEIIEKLESINDNYEPFLLAFDKYGKVLDNLENERENLPQNQNIVEFENYSNQTKSENDKELLNTCWVVLYFISKKEIKIEDLYRTYKSLTYSKVKFYNFHKDILIFIYRYILSYLIIVTKYIWFTLTDIKKYLNFESKNISRFSLIYFKNHKEIKNDIFDFTNFLDINKSNLPSHHLIDFIEGYQKDFEKLSKLLEKEEHNPNVNKFFHQNIRETVSNKK